MVIFTQQMTAIIVTGTAAFQLIVIALINVGAYLAFYKALSIGNLGTVSTLFATYAVGATVISVLFFAEPTTTARLVALGVVFVGVVMVSINDFKNLTTITGFKWVMAAAALLSIMFPFWDRYLTNNNGNFLFWVAIVDSLICIVFAVLVIYKGNKIPTKGLVTVSLGGLANTVAVAATTWGFATTNLTSVVVIISSTVPLVSATLGYRYFGERLIKSQYIGILMIASGTALVLST